MAEKQSITIILQTAQALIKKINSMPEDDPAVKEECAAVETLFKQIIEFERFYMAQADCSYFGVALANMETSIDFKQAGPVDVKINSGIGLSNFELTVNPLFCENYGIQEIAGLIESEVYRITFNHPKAFAQINSERDDLKHENLERASSAAVAGMITRDLQNSRQDPKGARLPKDMYTVNDINLETEMRPKEEGTLEFYYAFLDKYRKNNNQGSSSSMPIEGDGFASPENGKGNKTHDWEGQNEENLEASCKEFVSRVYNSIPSDKRGTIPAGLAAMIKALLAPPEIDWKRLLRKYVGAIPVPHRKTKTRLNRRQPERADLCGHLPKRIIDIVVAIDTSGSVDDRALSYIINEIFNIVKGREAKITIIECDADIQKIYQAKKPKDVQIKMNGRGKMTCCLLNLLIAGSSLELQILKGWGRANLVK